jgi:enoyl-CoA hydratase/carnithine racemase
VSYETILLEVEQSIAVLTLNRPSVRNAINLTMVDEIHAALHDLSVRDDVHVLIVAGAGDQAFGGGADIRELRERKRDDALRSINQGLFQHVEDFPRPTIAALHGWVLGGGCELAEACDLRVASPGARLGHPEVGLGIVSAAGGTQRLARLVGLGRAREMLFTARIVDAEEAHRIGLIDRIAEGVEVLEAAKQLAREIARHDPLAVRLTKVSINVNAGATRPGPAIESIAQATCFESEEKHRRMTAFLEGRRKRREEKA